MRHWLTIRWRFYDVGDRILPVPIGRVLLPSLLPELCCSCDAFSRVVPCWSIRSILVALRLDQHRALAPAMTDESRTPSLVGLPAEVSTIIWDLLFAGTIVTLYGNGHAGGAVISSFENHTIPSVFLVCKRSYLETRPIFANAMTLDFKAFDSRKRADRIPAGTQAYYYQYIKRLRTFDSGCGGLDLRALTNLKHLIVTGTLCCFISRSGCDCHAQDEYMDGVYLWERRDKQLMQLVSNDAPEGRFGQALQSTLIDPERAYSVSLTVKLRGVVVSHYHVT